MGHYVAMVIEPHRIFVMYLLGYHLKITFGNFFFLFCSWSAVSGGKYFTNLPDRQMHTPDKINSHFVRMPELTQYSNTRADKKTAHVCHSSKCISYCLCTRMFKTERILKDDRIIFYISIFLSPTES